MAMVTELFETILSNIEKIAKTETVVGEPFTSDGVTLIPISRVRVGFGAGGSEQPEKEKGAGGGGGGGISITPIAFIVIQDKEVFLLPMKQGQLASIVESIPDIIAKLKKIEKKSKESK
ncbi:sporulation protein [bacterium]|nr:MAG: sporulation protein [bacterium]